MKQKLTMILMMSGLSPGFVFLGAQYIAAAEKIAFSSERDGRGLSNRKFTGEKK